VHPLHQLINSFSVIGEKEWLQLFGHCKEIIIPKGRTFIKEGEKEKRAGFIMEGSMRQFYTKATGEEITTYFYFENNLVSGYISCITNSPSQITIEALEQTKIIVFPYSLLSELFDKENSWGRFGRKLSEYLAIGLEERMVSLLMDKPEERYIKLLNSQNKQKILERIPQQYIANYLGITPISLSRIRNRILKSKKIN